MQQLLLLINYIKPNKIKPYDDNYQLMNATHLRQTSSCFTKLSSHTVNHKKSISNQRFKTNPEQQIKTSHPNHPLLKIILLDNGHPLKDCKALLQSIKEQNSDEKQKMSLFYQEDLSQLLENLTLDQITLDQTHLDKINREITSKIKHFKLKKQNETFQNYSKLMTHSLRQHQKVSFLKQSSKINRSQDQLIPSLVKKSIKANRNLSAKAPADSSPTLLDQMMLEKRNQLAINSSSIISKEENYLEQIMKNRTVCQKVLEQALMFERYFDILKKQKLKIQQQNSQTPKNHATRVSNLTSKDKNKYFGKSAVKKLKNPNGVVNLNMRSNEFCLNPKHLRLQCAQSISTSHFDSESNYQRTKYMTKLKRDEYLKQINRIKEEMVQKRNKKNNVLIKSLMDFIRNNATNSIHEDKVCRKQSKSINESEKELRTSAKAIQKEKLKEMTGSGLTKILRRLFLIYCFMQTQESGSELQSLISKTNLDTFLNDFKIDIRAASHNNHKIRQILQKDAIDQFQFIQFIHILSSMQSYHFDNTETAQDFIHTNINKWVGKRILHPSYEVYLSLPEERLLKNNLRKELEKLRKLNRFQDKVLKVIDVFIEEERVSKLAIPQLFQDFDYVLEVLWFIKIYPTYVNKRTVRFYFEYLKQDKGSLLLASFGMSSKNKSFALIENIVWMVIAKASSEELTAVPQENEFQLNGSNISLPKTLDQVFIEKFKMVNKVLSQIIENKNSSRNHTAQQNYKLS